MKKIKTIILCLIIAFAMSGCGSSKNYETPEAVSKEMISLLSSGKYKEAQKLIYIDEDTFINEKSFENYLNNNSLIIKGNKLIELIEENSDEEQTLEFKEVKIRIDNNKIFKLNARQKNNKWYIDIGESEYDKNLTIQVPTNSTIKLNGDTIDKKYVTKLNLEEEISYGGSHYDIKFETDTYIIPKLIKGTYELEVKNDQISDTKVQINSNKGLYKEESTNKIFLDSDVAYQLIPNISEAEKEKLNKYINEYFNSLTTEINKTTPTINNLNKYYDSTDKFASAFEKAVKEKETKKSYSEEINSNLKLKNIDYSKNGSGIFYYGDDAIVACFEATFTYHNSFKYIGFMAGMNDDDQEKDIEKKIKILLYIKKEENTYKLKGGLSPIPNVFY